LNYYCRYKYQKYY